MSVKIPFNANIVVLQGCSGLHIIFYRLEKKSLLGTDPCKNHPLIILNVLQ